MKCGGRNNTVEEETLKENVELSYQSQKLPEMLKTSFNTHSVERIYAYDVA